MLDTHIMKFWEGKLYVYTQKKINAFFGQKKSKTWLQLDEA